MIYYPCCEAANKHMSDMSIDPFDKKILISYIYTKHVSVQLQYVITNNIAL